MTGDSADDRLTELFTQEDDRDDEADAVPGDSFEFGDGTGTDVTGDDHAGTDVAGAEDERASPDQPIGSRLSTGVDLLDRRLNGGVPPGRMVTLMAPPDTQSDLLVKRLVAERNCLYLSTLRPAWEIEEELRDHVQTAMGPDAGTTDVQVEEVSPERIVADPTDVLADLDGQSTLVVDAADEFEREDRSQYAQFLNDIKQRLWETGSIGLLYGSEEERPPPARAITLRRTDLVWRLRIAVDPEAISHSLVISKFRGGRTLTEPIKLVLTDDVRIDTSRDIA